jgi:hypothetical protein
MNSHLMRGLLALYPRAFRDRYGAELASVTNELIGAGEITPLLAALNLAYGAALEWARVLFNSRRTAQAMAAAAIVAVAGSLYITSQAPPQSMPATAHSNSAPAYRFSVEACSLRDHLLGLVAVKNAAAKPGQLPSVQVRPSVLVPGGLNLKVRPLPPTSWHALSRPSSAGPCAIVLNPHSERWIMPLAPGSNSPKHSS